MKILRELFYGLLVVYSAVAVYGGLHEMHDDYELLKAFKPSSQFYGDDCNPCAD